MNSATDDTRRSQTQIIILLTLLLSLLTVFWGWKAGRQITLIDDGGISFRYAERLSAGKGFTYNDGERVNGASDPLYVFLLAATNFILKDIRVSGIVLGIAALILTVVPATILFLRFHSPISLVLYIVLFISNRYLFQEYFNGLELGFTCAIITWLALFLSARCWRAVGFSLGLLVANKLDGCFAVIAFTIIYLFDQKRFPTQVAVWCVLGFSVVAIPLLLWTGTLIPQSLWTKLAGPAHLHTKHFLHGWMFPLIYWFSGAGFWIFLFGLPWLLWKRTFADFFLIFYGLIHLFLYSFINLGDYYPWYPTVPVYLVILCGSISSDYFAKWLMMRLRIPKRNRLVTNSGVAAMTILIILAGPGFNFWNTATAYVADSELSPSEKADFARAAMGAWLRKVAEPSEIYFVGWGLPAFEYKMKTFDDLHLTSPFGARPIPIYFSEKYSSLENIPKNQALYKLMAIFRIPDAPLVYAIYGAPNSRFFSTGNSFVELRKSTMLKAADFSWINNRQKQELNRHPLPEFPDLN